MARGSHGIGIILLGIWLVLEGILTLTGVSFPLQGTVMGALALVAGILLLIGR